MYIRRDNNTTSLVQTGVETPEDGGLDVDDIHKRKNLEVGQKILDYMAVRNR